jgi:hypothetical protein
MLVLTTYAPLNCIYRTEVSAFKKHSKNCYLVQQCDTVCFRGPTSDTNL